MSYLPTGCFARGGRVGVVLRVLCASAVNFYAKLIQWKRFPLL